MAITWNEQGHLTRGLKLDGCFVLPLLEGDQEGMVAATSMRGVSSYRSRHTILRCGFDGRAPLLTICCAINLEMRAQGDEDVSGMLRRHDVEVRTSRRDGDKSGNQGNQGLQ